MQSFIKALNWMSEWSGKVFSFSIYIGMFMLIFEVFSRYLFNAPTVWAHGYSQRIFGSYFIMIGGYTLLKGGHVRVDILYDRFSFRIKKLLDIVNYGLLLIWVLFLTKEGWSFFLYSYKLREVDEMVLAHPVYPVKFILLVGVIVIGLQGLSLMITTIISFIQGEEYESCIRGDKL